MPDSADMEAVRKSLAVPESSLPSLLLSHWESGSGPRQGLAVLLFRALPGQQLVLGWLSPGRGKSGFFHECFLLLNSAWKKQGVIRTIQAGMVLLKEINGGQQGGRKKTPACHQV